MREEGGWRRNEGGGTGEERGGTGGREDKWGKMNEVEGGGDKERGREQATTDTSLLS